ncbi:S-layer homology domain-containing protein [Alteribacillus bidgolensis]|nr:S-layer homology domain-containing protein [Alteribacillus bidgolensis]
MKIGKYILSLVFVFTLIAPVVSADSQQFTDVSSGFWAEKEIEYLAEEGIISGYEDGTFRPNEPVKRSQAASMIVEALDLDTTNRPAADFKDIDNSFHAYDVAATVQDEGIIGGRDGHFMPNNALTRGQMAAVLNRSFDFEQPEGTYNFADVDEEDTFYNDISTIAEVGVTTGYSEDNTFRPNNETTRAQFSVFLARVLDSEKFVEDDVAYPAVNLDVHFIDVGQGDSILLEPNGGGGNILIDGGRKGEGETVVQYLEEQGVNELEWVVATHPDADHIGGLIDVLNEIEVKNVLDSGKEHTTDTYFEYLETIDEKNINFEVAEEGDYLDTVTAEIQILNGYNDSSDLNESSIVLHTTYGETTALFTGDATVDNEAEMIEEYNVEADVLKVGHHGAATSTSAEFVEAVDPEMAILSYGENSYGHPDADVVDRLRNADVELYSTYESGDIEVSLSHQRPIIQEEKWTGDGEGEVSEPEPTPEPDPEPTPGVININTAGYEELQEITGVGPTIAERIIEYRDTYGDFESIEEIMNVSGIAEGRFEEMKDEITV